MPINRIHGGNIRAHLEKMTSQGEKIIDFSANINPLGIPSSARNTLRENIDILIHYPEPGSKHLKESLASFHDVGYKNERYKYFGWASAKLDDLVNFLPARLSALFLPLAGWLIGKDGLNSWKIAWRDGMKHPSPNSGFPEAAVAGALGIQLGGLSFYNSSASSKPFLGDNINPLETRHIKESIKIAYICSALALISGVALAWIITGRG